MVNKHAYLTSRTTTKGSTGTPKSNPQNGNPKLLRNQIKNQQKVLKYGQEFLIICQEICSNETLLEASAYIQWLTGNYFYTKELWKLCLEFYIKSRKSYQALVAALNPYDSQGLKEIYFFYLQNLTTSCRYCHYNLGSTNDGGEGEQGEGGEEEEDVEEMFTRLEGKRLQTLTATAAAATDGVTSVGKDPIYDFFNSIIWCNHPILLPYTATATGGAGAGGAAAAGGAAGGGGGLSSQDQALITSLYNSCGKLISFLELNQSKIMMTTTSAATPLPPPSSVVSSLHLPSSSSSSSSLVTHYLSLVQEIISTSTRLMNTLPSTLLSSSSLGNRLSRESLAYFRQYFHYLQYYTQYQQSVALLMALTSSSSSSSSSANTATPTSGKGGGGSGSDVCGTENEMKLQNCQEKCHLCDQVMRNIQEMIKLVQATTSTTLPTALLPSSSCSSAEESHEDLLLLSLRSLLSIYRTYRLVYLAESYGYYGLVLSSSSSPCPPCPSPSSPLKENDSGNEENILKSNLEKAYGLLEYADEIMNGEVYNCYENYSVGMTSTAGPESASGSGSSATLLACQHHLKALEALISGGKTRILAYTSLATLPHSSNHLTLQGGGAAGGAGAGGGAASHHASMVRYPNQWITLTTTTTHTTKTTNQNSKSKMKSKASGQTSKGSSSKKTSASGASTSAVILQPIPPLFEPIPCKPIFYDLASNYLDSTVNDVLDVRCGIKKKKSLSSSSTSLAPSAANSSSGAAGAGGGAGGGGGLVGTAASWLGWFSGSK